MSMSAGPNGTKDFQKLQLVFKVLDTGGYNSISLADAFKLFGMCRLPQSILMQILAYTDNTINGCLQFSELVQAMHLIYMVQSGHELTSDLLKNAGGANSFRLPKMEGLDKFLAEERMKSDTKLQQMDTPVLQLSQLMSPSRWSFSSLSRSSSQNENTNPLRQSVSRSSSKKEKTVSMEPSISEISITSFAKDMERLYKEKLKPLETEYHFCDFVLPPLLDMFAFSVDPLVMVLGESLTGKTSFIKQLLNSDYPRLVQSSEYGSTDRFYVIKHGLCNQSVPGSVLARNSKFRLDSLQMCGSNVFSCMEGAMLKNKEVLGYASFVDTPGIRTGHVNTSQYRKIILWYAHKCDMILLFSDPHNPKICAELKWLLSSLHGHEHKFRIVIYRVDDIDPTEMTKAYGSLMWSLGKVINSSDAFPVYIGFSEKDKNDFLQELKNYGKTGVCDRVIKELAKRAKDAKIHACIMSHLKKKMPFSWRITDQFQLCDNLEDDFVKVSEKFGIPLEEFPRVEKYKEVLKNGYDYSKWKKLKPKLIQAVDDLLDYDIPKLLQVDFQANV